jgi:4-methylaminobutanoate oxidase (formaldehyde-forming)
MTSAGASGGGIVIIGGGIGGLSAACHLALAGARHITLFEAGELSSGTTAHSTGNMETYRADPVLFEMVRYAAEFYPRLALETGRDIGWRVVGRVMYTDVEARWDEFTTLPELGRALDIDIELLTPTALERRLPIIDTHGLLGGVWIPGDARVNPTDAALAAAARARSLGVRILPRCPVGHVEIEGDRVRAVSTPNGRLECEVLVLAAGLWSGEVLRGSGLALPLQALEHQYLITRPLGIDPQLPLFLSYDDALYGREEVGGLIIGSLDAHAIVPPRAALPPPGSGSLISERWSQFEPYLARALERFPALRAGPVKMLLNGLEGFTPDGRMVLGPLPGVRGIYAACGFNSNGMALAPAAGRHLAEWIMHGAPSLELSALDARRFSAAQYAEDYVRERVSEIPSHACLMPALEHDYRTARNRRLSPLHHPWRAAGAHFKPVNEGERAAWLGAGLEPLEAVAAEVAAAGTGTLAIDRSLDTRVSLSGPGAVSWLESHARVLHRAAPGQLSLVALDDGRGHLAALVRLSVHHQDACLLDAAPEHAMRLSEWLRLCLPGSLSCRDCTADRAALELHGPTRHALLKRVLAEGAAGAHEPSKLDAPAVQILEDPLADSTMILFPRTMASERWISLERLGRRHGLRPGGHLAEEALRIERAIPAFGREVGIATRIEELEWPLRSRVRAFSSPAPDLGFDADQLIVAAGGRVGQVTSRVRLPALPVGYLLARMHDDSRQNAQSRSASLKTLIAGRWWPLTPRAVPAAPAPSS